MSSLRSAQPRRASIKEQQLEGFLERATLRWFSGTSNGQSAVETYPVPVLCQDLHPKYELHPNILELSCAGKCRLSVIGNGISSAFLMIGMCALDI